MQLAKSGNIQNVCAPNAMMTLMEYIMDYGNKELLDKAEPIIQKEIDKIQREDIKELTVSNIEKSYNFV